MACVVVFSNRAVKVIAIRQAADSVLDVFIILWLPGF